MKRFVLAMCLAAVACGSSRAALAAAPAKISELATVEELAGEARALAAKLTEATADEAAFKRAMEARTVNQDGGVLAVVAQALVEHEKGKDAGIKGPALRDAALQARAAKELAVAQQAVAAINAAIKGEGPDGAVEHPWNKLTGMGRMMVDLELRQGRLRRAFRRPKDLPSKSQDAAVMAVLALSMEVDTHEVKKPEDIPQWTAWSQEYRKNMADLAAAMRAGNAEEAQKLFNQSGMACDQCHEKFRP